MPAHLWRGAVEVGVEDGVAGGAQIADGVVELDGVPEGDRVQDQAERAELIFHPVAVAVTELAFAAVKRGAGEVVAVFLEVAHRYDLAPVGLVVDVGEDVQRLEDPPVLRERVTECRRPYSRVERVMGSARASRWFRLIFRDLAVCVGGPSIPPRANGPPTTAVVESGVKQSFRRRRARVALCSQGGACGPA